MELHLYLMQNANMVNDLYNKKHTLLHELLSPKYSL